MRLLLVNPNTSGFVTDRVAAAARAVARPGTEIVPVNGRFGARIIGTRTELAVAQHAMVDVLARHAGDCDAVVLAVSYDTALHAAREMLDVPVVGITEAALLTACLLGTRIGVIVYGRRTLPLYQELVASHGFTGRIAGWRVLETTAVYGDGDQAAADAAAIAAANDLVERDFAEVVVLTGAVMAGVPPRLQPSVPVPLLEGVGLAVRQAEMLVDLKPVKPRCGGYAPLPVRELVDVDPVLAARFGGT